MGVPGLTSRWRQAWRGIRLWPFPAPRGCCIPWPGGLSSACAASSVVFLSCLQLSCLRFPFKDPCDAMGPTWITQGPLPSPS